MVQKRQEKKVIGRAKAKPRSRAASAPRKKPSRRKPSRKPLDVQQQVFRVFAEQADSLWNGLTDQCRQFAYGFNQAVGAPALQVLAEPTMLRVAYPQADAELLFQFDKTERYVQAWMNIGMRDLWQLPGRSVAGRTHRQREASSGSRCRGDVASDEHLAVTLLKQLTSGIVEAVVEQ